MNRAKQNILVSAILFLSLLLSVAISYAITPNSASMTEVKHTKLKANKLDQTNKPNQSLEILPPKKGQ